MACLFRVIDSSTRKSASSRDNVATVGRGEGAEGGDGGDDGDDGAGGDGFVMDEACYYAPGCTGIGIVAAAFEYSNWARRRNVEVASDRG